MEFLKVAAHQLKSPISTIQTSLRTLLEGFAEPLTATQQSILEGADRKTRESLNLLNYILELSRMERMSRQDFKPLALGKLVDEIIASFEERARAKKLAFEVRIARTVPLVLGYAPGLHLALANLLDNAFKYTPKDGKVRFMLAYDSARELLSGKVIDSGIGIPRQEQKYIFDEFYRASNAAKFSRSGSGLGMSIVKKAVTLHNGKIRLKSGGGQGTTVEFEMQLKRAASEDSEERETAPGLRIVVVGGVAAGPKAAAKARRNDQKASITIVEKGEFLSYSGCGLPYYISGKVNDQKDLMTTAVGVNRDPDYFRLIKNIEVLNKTEAIAIDREAKQVTVRDLRSGKEFQIPYDQLVLTTGAEAKIPSVPGLDLGNILTLQKIRDAEALRSLLGEELAKDAVIIGGGLIGTETAEALTEGGARVSMVEQRDHILTMLDPEIASLVEKHMRANGVKIFTGESLVAFKGAGSVEKVITTRRELPADFVLMATGVQARVELARAAGLEIGVTGAIKVDKHMRTSDPDIYAGGDCVENIDLVTNRPIYLPLGGTANKHGRVIGINVTGGKESFRGITATTILKVFDYNVSKVGLSAAEAEYLGYRVETSLCPAPDKAHYYPGSKLIVVKLVADKDTERLLGAQVVGPGDVSKRADIAASLVFKKGSVDDLAKVDLAYAPPYSEAIDCISHAANILKNKLAGIYKGISPLEVKGKIDSGTDIMLIDVRTQEEFETESIADSQLIPLGTLRGRLSELPRDREIVLIGSSGIRAYEAALIMQAEGFPLVKAMDGGMETWPFAKR